MLDQITYDELPYTCSAMPYAQPDRLATLASLFGMTPPPVPKSRVLELGSCNGSNIIATAHNLPEASCWGVDLSAQHIADGQALVEALGLQNITLEHKNILEVDERIGMFDYIIAHGIYSWVSPDVQEQILSICKHHLTPNGVAYISYNTKPGWDIRSTVRDMMSYYTAQITGSEAQTEQLKALLKFFADTTKEGQDAYSRFVSEEIGNFNQLPESFLFQNFVKEECKPLYFYQFVEQARGHGLEYLGDAFLHTMLTDSFPAPVAKSLHTLKNDLIHQEQMMDFLRNRRFRHTLLCHQDISLNRALSADLIRNFYIASSLQPVAQDSQTVQKFGNVRGALTSDKPIIQATLRYLAKQWPHAKPFTELVKQANGGYVPNTQDQTAIAQVLFQSYSRGLIELYSNSPQFITTVSPHPQTTNLVRWQAQRSQFVTNRRCEWIKIDNVVCLSLLPHLDGNHNHAALVGLLRDWLKQGKFALNIKNQATNEPLTLTDEQERELLGKLLNDALRAIAQVALLVA